MCPPQAQAEVGPTMTEKAEMLCAPSPAPAPPPKPASPGPPQAEGMGHRSTSPPRLPPGVPVISLGHTRPPGAALPTTELSTLRPPLLQLSALGTAPPALALHYHPHPFLNSVYIGPAGPFSIFPSSRLKRRPSHCELDLAEGECGCTRGLAVSVWDSRLSHTRPRERGFQCTQRTAPTGYNPRANHSPLASSTKPPPPDKPSLVATKRHGRTDFATTGHGSHKMTAPLECTATKETAIAPESHRRQPQDHNHWGNSHSPTTTWQRHTQPQPSDMPRVGQPHRTLTEPQSQQDLSDREHRQPPHGLAQKERGQLPRLQGKELSLGTPSH
nr:protein lyl-1 isoform X2 [Microcebus murinus]